MAFMNTSDANSSSSQQPHDRREHSRKKVRVPVELRSEGNDIPMRGTTSDISLNGCYVEMMFTLAKGTEVKLSIKINGTVLALGTVVASDPNVGNGLTFTKMISEDREELRRYLSTITQHRTAFS